LTGNANKVRTGPPGALKGSKTRIDLKNVKKSCKVIRSADNATTAHRGNRIFSLVVSYAS